MQLKAALRRVPILGPLAVALKRRLRATGFTTSADYWESRYRTGGTSGAGSYNRLAEFKARVLNEFVERNDIRSVVEELWIAGAEAIAINRERITPTTAIIDIGSSLLVNSAYLAPPYQVTAIGSTDLYDRLSRSPGFVDFVRSRAEAYGIRLSFAEPESVDMPAFAGTVTLRYSRPLSSPAAAPAGELVGPGG